MSYHWKWLALILACMVEVAHADAWDDFANNLFSDLAPLLALFGERVTMQFMSQSLGWEDCVVLATAPLGIITILVSAIRVGGPAWLKAVIGRARENISAAEMELMSSTSEEVCELYNGKNIVRCQGSTPVWEFIYLIPRLGEDEELPITPGIKTITLAEACRGGNALLHKQEARTNKMARILNKAFPSWLRLSDRRVHGELDSELGGPLAHVRVEVPGHGDTNAPGQGNTQLTSQIPQGTIYIIKDTRSGAPNIMLNLQSNRNSLKELRAYALIGVVLQSCVLVFFAIITYHPTAKRSFLKDDQPVDNYAFPLTFIGTLVLILGMFFCGTIVESSTQETEYKKNDAYGMRVVWIQQMQIVGDQVFKPFATFPGSPRDIVTMSHRCEESQTQALGSLTVTSIFIGLAGFIVQFIGLRGMNSAATLAQLGAVGIMTAIRAWVRRGLARPPQEEKLPSGFELDSLAWALTLMNHSRINGLAHAPLDNAGGGGCQPTERTPQEFIPPGIEQFMTLEQQKTCLWTIFTGGDVNHKPLMETFTSRNSKEQHVLETRRNLCRLAGFKGASATEAIDLARAMEKVMSVFFPPFSGDSESHWMWPLPVASSDSELTQSPQCDVFLSVIAKDGSWKVLADQLESILSLCLFTAHKQSENQMRHQPEFDLNNERNDLLRQETMNSGFGIRLLGSPTWSKTDQLIQDLRWWAPETFDTLAEVQELESLPNNDQNTPRSCVVCGKDRSSGNRDGEFDQILKPNPKLDAIRVDDNRVVGYGPARLQPRDRTERQRYFANSSVICANCKPKNGRGTLAIESNDSLEKLYAKDLLFSFLISAAKALNKPLQSEVTTRPTSVSSAVNGCSKALVTKETNSLAAELLRLGYGTEHEVWASMIASLSIAEKLPFPEPFLDLPREGAREMRREHRRRGRNA